MNTKQGRITTLQEQLRDPNFFGRDGSFYLIRCYHCDPEYGRENWAMAVATGTCNWCGWSTPDA